MKKMITRQHFAPSLTIQSRHVGRLSACLCSRQVSYRYNVVKARMQLLQARLADINAMVGGWVAGWMVETMG
jgi:hypothetical protein